MGTAGPMSAERLKALLKEGREFKLALMQEMSQLSEVSRANHLSIHIMFYGLYISVLIVVGVLYS
jgi:hypothetical protein